jgi:hypothetical protein
MWPTCLRKGWQAQELERHLLRCKPFALYFLHSQPDKNQYSLLEMEFPHCRSLV